jgi:hypothetical protein
VVVATIAGYVAFFSISVLAGFGPPVAGFEFRGGPFLENVG